MVRGTCGSEICLAPRGRKGCQHGPNQWHGVCLLGLYVYAQRVSWKGTERSPTQEYCSGRLTWTIVQMAAQRKSKVAWNLCDVTLVAALECDWVEGGTVTSKFAHERGRFRDRDRVRIMSQTSPARR